MILRAQVGHGRERTTAEGIKEIEKHLSRLTTNPSESEVDDFIVKETGRNEIYIGYINLTDPQAFCHYLTTHNFNIKQLEIEANNEYNLFTADQDEPNGVSNFFDLAVFAEDWGRSSYD